MKRLTALAVSAALAALPAVALAQTPAPGTVVPPPGTTTPMNPTNPPAGAMPGGGQKMGTGHGKMMGAEQGGKGTMHKQDKMKDTKKHAKPKGDDAMKANPPPKATP